MLRNLVVLPDGTELFSGGNTENAILNSTITASVNDSQDLAPGSTCTSMLDMKVITPEGGLPISAGDELALYKVDDAGTRHKVGLFTTEKPTRASANTLRITAYDRITRLDKDLTAWMATLDQWPYSLYDFAKMVCEICQLPLANESIPNGDFPVRRFSASGITGRQLIQWVGQAAGMFCRATVDGEAEFAWYTSSGITVSPSGDRYYFQNSLSFEDYQVAPVKKVLIQKNDEDTGFVYPDIEGTVNTFVVSGNYLLTAEEEDDLLPVAQTLYKVLNGATYTPCRISVPAALDIQAGHTVQIVDANGKEFTTYVMTKTQSGQRDTLECTGNPSRDSTGAMNNQSFKALSGKLLEIQKSVDGLTIKASEIEQTGKDQYVSLSSRISQNAVQVSLDFSRMQEAVDANTAGRIEVSTHIRFDADGIHMGSSDSTMTQQLKHDRNVFRSSGEEVSGTDAHKHWAKRIEGTESGQLGNLEFKRRSNGNAIIRYKRR